MVSEDIRFKWLRGGERFWKIWPRMRITLEDGYGISGVYLINEEEFKELLREAENVWGVEVIPWGPGYTPLLSLEASNHGVKIKYNQAILKIPGVWNGDEDPAFVHILLLLPKMYTWREEFPEE